MRHSIPQNTWSKLCIDTNGAAQGSKLIQSKCEPRQDDQNFECDLAVRSIKRRRANQCWTVGELNMEKDKINEGGGGGGSLCRT